MKVIVKNQGLFLCREKKTQNKAWWLPSNLWGALQVFCGETFLSSFTEPI